MNRCAGGVYILTNKVNGMQYVGQTKNFEHRMERHYTSKATLPISKALTQLGRNSFVKILIECDKEDADFFEQFWITALNTMYPNGYNLRTGGTKGFVPSEETRKKLSAGMSNRFISEETKKRLSESKRGNKNPMYGKPLPEEHRQKIANAHMGEKNHFWGKKHSPETLEKLRTLKLGKRLSPEHVANLRIAQKKRWKEFKERKYESGK